MSEDLVILDDAMHDELMAVSAGAMNACYQCGTCTAICPWGLVREEHLGVRSLMRSAQFGLPEAAEQLWLCTACRACEFACPRDVAIVDTIRALRSVHWKRREAPAALVEVAWNYHDESNPNGEPRSRLDAWAKGLEFTPVEDTEVLLHVGTAVATDQRMWPIARAASQLLTTAGVKHAMLGPEEPVAGEFMQSVGEEGYLSVLQDKTRELLATNGLTNLVCLSPHAVAAFQDHPAHGELFEAWHYIEWLEMLVNKGRLVFDSEESLQSLAYHDPCLNSRGAGLIDTPRDLLETASSETMEFKNHGLDGLCCGGGNGRMFLETEAGERFSDLRLEEAVEKGVDNIVTSCPWCIQMLEDSARMVDGARDIKVWDMLEVLLPLAKSGPKAKSSFDATELFYGVEESTMEVEE